MSNDPFYGLYGADAAQTIMGGEGLSVIFNLPKARESCFAGGVEVAQSLPEYAPRCAYLVDDFPAAPEAWMRSKPGVLSYMVPVKAEHGIWLDFNRCRHHTHHVAVRISVQGVCALTYRKTDDAHLEQYRKNCPKHNVPFVGNRRCPECGYEWPAQNYLATTGTPNGYFWLDGFRMPDGTTRQYVLTEDEARSVAKAILGEQRVHAIGVQFFLSKNPKPLRHPVYRGGEVLMAGGVFSLDDVTLEADCDGCEFEFLGLPEEKSLVMRAVGPVQPVKKFEVAAGAKIQQAVYPDPEDLDFWAPEPALTVVINYTDEVTMQRVLAAGRTAASEGPLGELGIPVGHSKH